MKGEGWYEPVIFFTLVLQRTSGRVRAKVCY